MAFMSLNTKERVRERKKERKMMGSLGLLHTPALGSLPLSSCKVTHFVYSNRVFFFWSLQKWVLIRLLCLCSVH